MKLKQPLKGEYDPEAGLLTISGANSAGKTSSVVMSVDDPNVFIGWIVAVLLEKFESPDDGGKALIADSIAVSLHPDSKGGHDLIFAFMAGEIKLSFSFAVHTRAPEKLAAIKGHIDQALAEVTDSSTPKLQ